MILRDARRSARPLVQTAAGQPATASGGVRDPDKILKDIINTNLIPLILLFAVRLDLFERRRTMQP